MDKIVLKNMGFYAYHGNLPSEMTQGQRFFVDVTVLADLTKPGQTDQLEDSINYVDIYDTVERIMTETPCKLLERVGSLIADELWNSNKGIVGLAVTVRKPSVPISGMLDYVEVTITRGQI